MLKAQKRLGGRTAAADTNVHRKRRKNTQRVSITENSSRYPLIPPRSRLEAVYSARAKPRKFAPGIHRAYTLLPTAGDNHSGAKTQTKLVNIVIVENGGSL
ncbi:hypothetical protein M8J77_013146 [Diaphorina citri]|nr:hypothetical protein M8J77_013146 [Diaphorina citri]